MSLSGIKNRRQPTIFGKDLNVLIGDTTINGDLDILGNINGTSSQGQNTNNTWTGTNEYSVERPTCPVAPAVDTDALNDTALNAILLSSSIINQPGANFTGTNTFNQIPTISSLGFVPSNATDAVNGKYVIDNWNTKSQSYLSANNTWTGTNVFTTAIPTANDPVNATDACTKNYTDTHISGVAVGNAVSSVSQVTLTNADWGTQFRAVEVQIIGGGGGSTSAVGTCVCSSAGVSGGSGAQASIILLTGTTIIPGFTTLAVFGISVGGGGGAGTGCGVGSGSGGGGATSLVYVPKSGIGFATTGIDINILRANGGGGFGGTCGQPGNSGGGTYSNINTQVTIVPFSSANGRGGSQCAGSIPQYYGYNQYGWGAPGRTCANGAGGSAGGYSITGFKL